MVQVWGWKWGEWGVGHYCEVARRVQEYLGFRVVVARKVHSADAGAGGGVWGDLEVLQWLLSQKSLLLRRCLGAVRGASSSSVVEAS